MSRPFNHAEFDKIHRAGRFLESLPEVLVIQTGPRESNRMLILGNTILGKTVSQNALAQVGVYIPRQEKVQLDAAIRRLNNDTGHNQWHSLILIINTRGLLAATSQVTRSGEDCFGYTLDAFGAGAAEENKLDVIETQEDRLVYLHGPNPPPEISGSCYTNDSTTFLDQFLDRLKERTEPFLETKEL